MDEVCTSVLFITKQGEATMDAFVLILVVPATHLKGHVHHLLGPKGSINHPLGP